MEYILRKDLHNIIRNGISNYFYNNSLIMEYVKDKKLTYYNNKNNYCYTNEILFISDLSYYTEALIMTKSQKKIMN